VQLCIDEGMDEVKVENWDSQKAWKKAESLEIHLAGNLEIHLAERKAEYLETHWAENLAWH
jgi:hypothetical protein